MKKFLISMGIVFFITSSHAQTGSTCATSLNFDTTNVTVTGMPFEKQIQQSQWYAFSSLNTKVDINIRYIIGADKINKAILWGGTCSSLTNISSDTLTSGIDSILTISTISISVNSTYYLQIFKSNNSDTALYQVDLNFLFPPPTCTACSGPVIPCDLICNGKFENYSSMPTGMTTTTSNQFIKACPWRSANLNTPDFYYVGAPPIVSIPGPNFGGSQASNITGHLGYAGIVARWPATSSSVGNEKEMMYQTLAAPMVAGKTYTVEMKVSLSDYSKYKVNGLGMSFYNTNPYQGVVTSITYTPSKTVTTGTTYVTNTSGWQTLSWTYVAAGGEAYVAVGCFGGNIASTTPAATPPTGSGNWAYYYIDEISVKEVIIVTSSPSPSTICSGNSSNLTSTPTGTGYTYSWDAPGNIGFSTASNPTVSPTSTTTYTVTVTNSTGCTGTSTVIVNVNPLPSVDPVSNITVCPSDNVTGITFTSTPVGATFSWVNSEPSIGLAPSGTGNMPSFTATNTTAAPLVGAIFVTPTLNSCSGPPMIYTITVNPKPTVNSSSIPNINVCHNGTVSATNFASTPSGATYTWTNSNTAIGLGASGSGNISSFTGTNTTTAAISGTITVTPTYLGCIGTPATYTITVNPLPTVSVPSNISVCNGNSVAATSFTSIPSGGTYQWTNSNTSIGLSSSGSGNIPSFSATNSTGSSITGTIAVTPTVSGCVGTASSYTITVSPSSSVTASASPTTINLYSSSSLSATATPSTGVTYSWSPSTGLSNPNVQNPTASPYVTTTYTVTATNGICTATNTVTVTVLLPAQCGVHVDYNLPDGTNSTAYFGNNISINGKNIQVNGTFNIDGIITFANCNIIVAANGTNNGKINIVGTSNLTLTEKTHVYSCSGMWDGIIIPSGGSLQMTGYVFIEDAVKAVTSQNGGRYEISSSIFNRNYTGVDVEAYSGTHPGYIRNTIFTSRLIPSNASASSNPTVGAIKSALITYAAANMKSPNSGTKSVNGVNATDVNNMAIGFDGLLSLESSTSWIATNTFDNLGCGVRLTRTNATLYNNNFQNMVNQLVCMGCPQILGRAIYAVGTTTGTNTITIGGSSTWQPNTFSGIYQSIYLTNYQTSNVLYNTITNASTLTGIYGTGHTGIFIQPSQNNTVDIENNEIHNCVTGIWVNRNNTSSISALNLIVDANIISADASGFCTTGINVTDLLAGTTVIPITSEIKDNVITETVNCINLANIKKPVTIEANSVTVRYTATGARNGIKAVGCQNLSIINNHTKYNNVGGTAYTSGGNILAYGIFLQNSTNMLVSCNLSEDAARSMVFQGTCTSPTATGFGITQNTMRRAQDGFVLLNSGVIGTQGSGTIASNNYWDLTTTPTFANSQTYTDGTTGANTNSKLYMNNITTGANATMPTNNQTSGLLVDAYTSGSGLNISTGSPFSCGIIPALAPSGEGDGLRSMESSSERNNELRDYSVDPYQEYIQMLENAVVGTNDESEEIRWMRKKYVFDEISNNNLSGSTTLDSFYTTNHNFAVLESIEHAFGDKNYLQADILNSAFAPTNTIENNHQIVNSLILAELMDSSYIYTVADKTVLNNIANQCPVVFGNAVYQARNLLMTIEENIIEFTDICEEYEKSSLQNLASKKTESHKVFSLYPNPNNGNMVLKYSLVENEFGQLEIEDITGKTIKQIELKPNSEVLYLNEQLESGIYLYRVIIDNKIEISDKLIIIK